MAGPNTNLYGDISPRTASYAAKQLLKRGMYMLITERFAQVKPLPQRSSRSIKFRRYLELDTTPVPLAEGVTPPGKKLTYEDIHATVEQYGDWMELTDVIMDTHEDPVLNEMMELLGEQAPEILEKVRIEVLKGGSNVYYAGGVASRDLVATSVAVNDLRAIVRSFKDDKAKYFTQIIKASTGIDTTPVGPSFFALGHTDLEHNLRELTSTGFVPIEQYADSMDAIPGEVGKIENIRFVLTPLFTSWVDASDTDGGTTWINTTTTQADVYPIIILSPNAWGVVPLKGKTAITPKVLNPGIPRGGDPLGQIGSVGWKTWHTAVILQDLWMCRYEVLASVL